MRNPDVIMLSNLKKAYLKIIAIELDVIPDGTKAEIIQRIVIAQDIRNERYWDSISNGSK